MIASPKHTAISSSIHPHCPDSFVATWLLDGTGRFAGPFLDNRVWCEEGSASECVVGRHFETVDPDGNPMPKKNAVARLELFNLKADPYEKTNLAESNAAKVAELRADLQAFAKQAVPPKAKPKAADFVAPRVWGEKR